VISKQIAILSVGSFAAGAILAFATKPAKIVTKTQTVYQDRVVEKVVEHQVTVQVETKKKDGTDVIETKTVADSGIDLSSQIKAIQNTEKTVTYGRGLEVGVMADYNVSTHSPSYGAYVSKQVLGPISVGAYGQTNGSLGLTLGIGL
jgi:hypothetical protein